MRQFKIIVDKHPDGYVAYPLGVKGVGCIPYLSGPLTFTSPPEKGRGKGKEGTPTVPSPPFRGRGSG